MAVSPAYYGFDSGQPLRVIIYSSWRRELSDTAVVDMILRAGRANWDTRVSGAIWFGEKRFYQVIEGESRTIETLYEKITRDDRHHMLDLLKNDLVGRRAFNGWSMHVFVGPEDRAIADLTRRYVKDSIDHWQPAQGIAVE